MAKKTYQILWILLLSLLIGCEDKQIAINGLQGNPPFLGGISLSPDSTNIDGQIPLDGMYTVTTVVSATVTDPEGASSLARVVANVVRPNSSTSILTIDLHDDGVSPDPIAGDGNYSANVQYRITRPQAGRYRISVHATDKDGLRSNISERSLFVTRNNSRPILSNLVAPDSVRRPAAGTSLIFFSVAVHDSDGYGDINTVFFQRIQPSPSSTILMFDDGNRAESGDSVAGDGVFTRKVIIDPTAILGNQLFVFLARDGFGGQSDSTFHTITILP